MSPVAGIEGGCRVWRASVLPSGSGGGPAADAGGFVGSLRSRLSIGGGQGGIRRFGQAPLEVGARIEQNRAPADDRREQRDEPSGARKGRSGGRAADLDLCGSMGVTVVLDERLILAGLAGGGQRLAVGARPCSAGCRARLNSSGT